MNIMENIKNIDKRLLIAIVIITILIVLGIYYLIGNKSFKKEEPLQDEVENILDSLTAPNNSSEPISEEIQESLSAPVGSNQPDEEVLNSLTAPIQ